MATFKSLPSRKLPKADREQAVLFGLIELYLKMGKPIGSQTLQEQGFESLSSATIRNYLSKMEAEGYVAQQHTSGGRVPTDKALRVYIEANLSSGVIDKGQEAIFKDLFQKETKEIATLLNRSANLLSEMTQCAVILSTPRFDQDFVQDVKMVQIDPNRLLAVLITDFGLIRTETIYLEKGVDASFLKSFEEYCLWRINRGEKPLFREEKEAKLAQRLYNEVMVRHVVGYANFSEEELIRTGLSKLLSYPEFNDATSLASSLSLLEDERGVRSLLRQAMKEEKISSWVGEELSSLTKGPHCCTILASSYRIGPSPVGAIALLGPTRIPYKNLFGLLTCYREQLSQMLTKTLYKYKMSFRKAVHAEPLLENKRK